MKKLLPVLGIALLGLGLAGCSSAESAPQSTPTSPAVAPATPVDAGRGEATDEGEKSERGNIIKKVGQAAGITDQDNSDDTLVNFVVKNIEVDPPCTAEYAEPAENGHFVTVDIAAETGPAKVFEKLNYGNDFSFSPGLWKFVTPQGTTVNSIASTSSFMCLNQQEQLPATIGPAEKVRGKIVLDVPSTKGTAIYDDIATGTGWEWPVPTR